MRPAIRKSHTRHHLRTHRPVTSVSGGAHLAPSGAPLAHTSETRASLGSHTTWPLPTTTLKREAAAGPAGPTSPLGPGSPVGPTGPATPCGPGGPGGPASPLAPTGPCAPGGPCGPGSLPHPASKRHVAPTMKRCAGGLMQMSLDCRLQPYARSDNSDAANASSASIDRCSTLAD